MTSGSWQLRAEDFQAIFERLPYPVIMRHLELGRYVFVNQAFERLFGFPRDEIVGRRPDEVEFWSTRDELERVVTSVQMGQAKTGEQVAARTRDGRLINCTFMASPVRLGEVVVIVGILTGPSEILAPR